MADQLATPEQLASLLQQDLDAATADVVLNAATAVVQQAARQRLVLVEDDELRRIGTTESWLWLPERPVTEVTSIVLDGETLTVGDDLKEYLGEVGALWRACGWSASSWRPSTVDFIYSHGYQPDDQRLELARSATLSLAAVPYSNPSGSTQVKIDDYAEVFSALSARMEAAPERKKALRAQYGRRTGLVKVG